MIHRQIFRAEATLQSAPTIRPRTGQKVWPHCKSPSAGSLGALQPPKRSYWLVDQAEARGFGPCLWICQRSDTMSAVGRAWLTAAASVRSRRTPHHRALLRGHHQTPRDPRGLHSRLLRRECLPRVHQRLFPHAPSNCNQIPSRVPSAGYSRRSIPLPRCYPQRPTGPLLRAQCGRLLLVPIGANATAV